MNRKWIAVAAIVLIVAVPVGLKIARGAKPKEIETHAVALQAVRQHKHAAGARCRPAPRPPGVRGLRVLHQVVAQAAGAGA